LRLQKSLGIASRLAEKLADNGYGDLNVEIHLDIGQNGETKDLIREIRRYGDRHRI